MKTATAALLALLAAGIGGCSLYDMRAAGCGDKADGERWCQACGAPAQVAVRCSNGKTYAFTDCAAGNPYCAYLPTDASSQQYTPVR